MEYNITEKSGSAQVNMSGQFVFSDNPKFKAILEMAQARALQSLAIDFTNVSFIDSAGLGMLLLLRDICAEKNVSISLVGAHGQVAKVFDISKFGDLFNLAS